MNSLVVRLTTARDAKLAGNDAFKRGTLMAKHTAGKESLKDACIQVLAGSPQPQTP